MSRQARPAPEELFATASSETMTNAASSQTSSKATESKKKLYSAANITHIVNTVVDMCNDRLPTTKHLSMSEVVEELDESLPPAVIVNLAGAKTASKKPRTQCIARNMNTHVQCKNECVGKLCGRHTKHPPQFTIETPIEEIEKLLHEEKIEKEVEKLKARAKAKAEKKASKASSEGESVKCHGMKGAKKDTPCNNRVKDGLYCHHHKDQEPKEPEEPSASQTEAAESDAESETEVVAKDTPKPKKTTKTKKTTVVEETEVVEHSSDDDAEADEDDAAENEPESDDDALEFE